MKAAWFSEFGSAREVLEVGQRPPPEPAAGEVLVRLHASGVNPSDVKKRAGQFPELLDGGAVIPHSDGAGVVESVGDGVHLHARGDRVWVYQAQFARRFGTAAEYVALDAHRAVALPDGIDYPVGACMGIPAMTAHRCVFADGSVTGQRVLVTGGAGRVAHYAIQWACLAGASVCATASNEADVEACRGAGAEFVVNHRAPDWAQQLLDLNGGQPMDRVVDVQFGANLPQVLKLIRTGGVIATYSSTQELQPRLPFLQMMYMDLTVRLVIVYAMPESAKQQATDDITRELHSDSLQHRIAARLPLREIAQAHEIIEEGRCRGCVIVTM